MGKKNKKANNKVIYKKLKLDKVDLSGIVEKNELHFESIRSGDIYILKDYEYSKARHDIPNTKTIKFERPVIIMTVSDTSGIASIIPITTSTNIKDSKYPIKIEYGKCSYALLNQFTTVDTSRLSLKIGVLKEEVFNDIRKTLNSIMEFSISKIQDKKKECRTIHMDNSKLDIVRFNPYHIYYNYETGNGFLCLQLDNRDKIAIKVIVNNLPYTYDNTLRASFVLLDLDRIYRINKLFYSQYNYKDIGVEFNLKIRTKIINKFKEMYNMNILNAKDTDYLTEFSKVISEICTNSFDYIRLYRKMYNYITKPKYQALVLTNTEEKLKEFANDIGFNYKNDNKKLNNLLAVLRPFIIESISIFKTNTSSLNFAKANYPNILKPIILHYASSIKNKDCINTSIVENTDYFKKNLKWVASYIRNQK